MANSRLLFKQTSFVLFKEISQKLTLFESVTLLNDAEKKYGFYHYRICPIKERTLKPKGEVKLRRMHFENKYSIGN
jgi:hypothetical protein